MDLLKVPKLLGGSNYDIWSIRVEAILTEKGYLGEMVRSTNLPITPEMFKRRKKALAYIRLTLGDGPLIQTQYIDDPVDLWEALKELYSIKGFNSEFYTSRELIIISI